MRSFVRVLLVVVVVGCGARGLGGFQAPDPRLERTRFIAFGDSLTEGKVSSGDLAPRTYPSALYDLLAGRYTGQREALSVIPRGCGGEQTRSAPFEFCGFMGGVDRLRSVLDADRPDVLLLLEGTNDLYWSNGNPEVVAHMIDGLVDMVREAKRRGVTVFLATLPPAHGGGEPPRGARVVPLLSAANMAIRQVAVREHVELVDLHQALDPARDVEIGVDGLHPTATGYEHIASTFFDAIQARLEARDAGNSPSNTARSAVPQVFPSAPF